MTLVFRLTRFLKPANSTEFNKSVDNRRPGVPHLRKNIVRACAYYRKTNDPVIRYSYVILLILCGSFDFHLADTFLSMEHAFFNGSYSAEMDEVEVLPI